MLSYGLNTIGLSIGGQGVRLSSKDKKEERAMTQTQDEANTWLAQVSEEIIDPALPIIDPHHHLWRHEENPYLLKELWADTGCGHNVRATVFVECGSEYWSEGHKALAPVGETEFVAGLAQEAKADASSAQIGAIVGHGDLLLGSAIEDVLSAHQKAGQGLFRGIRHSGAYDPSPEVKVSHSKPPADIYERRETIDALKILGTMGLTFDAYNYHPYIPRLASLVDKVPDTLFILDHFGGPLGIGPYEGRRDEIFKTWAEDIAELSKRDNIVMKVGGMAMPVNGWGWHRAARPVTSDEFVVAQARYYHHTIECFGAERCMFESNFPVDRRSLSYPVLWNAFKKIAGACSKDEKASLFFETARRTYRIELAD